MGYASENGTIFHVSHSTFCIHPWNLQAEHAGFVIQFRRQKTVSEKLCTELKSLLYILVKAQLHS